MSKWMVKKEFEKLFLPYNESGTQIWVIANIKRLPCEIADMAINLAKLDFIKYVRITEDTLAASSENEPKRPKVPITRQDHLTAIGVQILYSIGHKYIDFFDINSPVKGNGSKMVDAIFKDFPKDWNVAVTMNWNNEFWTKMEDKYSELEWII